MLSVGMNLRQWGEEKKIIKALLNAKANKGQFEGHWGSLQKF